VKLNIIKGKNILNMDKSRAHISYPTGKHVIMPIEVKELYTISPENRKLVMIIETIYIDRHEFLSLFIITSGKKIMDNWVLEKLVSTEHIKYTSIGYINNNIAIKYLNYLIKYLKAGLNKPWKVLFLNGHESHVYKPF
jgi:hypothetical protein